VGGPIIQNKLFFFADVERIKQDAQASATTSPTFAAIQTQYPFIPAPFRDTFSLARVDWNAPKGMHVFARIAYGVTSDDSNYADLYSLYNSRNNVPAYVGGVDFTTGRFTHSFRGGYEKFHNLLSDGTAGVTSIYNPSTAIGVPVTLLDGQDGFYAGPNYLAPQGTYQSGKQIRYDGTWTKGQHSVRFGASMNRLLGGGFAEFYGQSLYTVFGAANLVSGGNPADPINGYAAEYYILGNGNGFFSEKPGFGLKGGGLEDWRSAWYVGDTWKVSQSLTASFGLRWSVDTDRANQDLPTPSCASVAPSLQFPGCTSTSNTNLFDQFQQGLGKPTKQPYANFAPQVGFVFSPGAHKFAFRGGAGIFYDSDIFNNTSNARSQAVNANGNYFNYAGLCGQFHARVIMPDGSVVTSINGVSLSTVCAEPIAQAAPQVAAVKAAYQAASQTGGP
ncbi:MAG: TonB-dependent receptor, partial [Acidobacteriota bacterium]|nr:TonB-dependent receptor [Acidobacteriota bacterium]